jgi:hypothetical protein
MLQVSEESEKDYAYIGPIPAVGDSIPCSMLVDVDSLHIGLEPKLATMLFDSSEGMDVRAIAVTH